jgi:uncharacterized protein YdeI (YjbR/CyaY-like superfamily)
MNPEVDAYLARAKTWQQELAALRKILLEFPLREKLKWGKPCYSFDGHNVIVVQPFKQHCALLFCKGALLRDAEQLLVRPGENTQAARQFRFTDVAGIAEHRAILRAYLAEAIAVEKAGLEVTYKTLDQHEVPAELQQRLDASPALKNAFESLTPGRQRAYFLFIAGAKQTETRAARVEKCAPRMLQGKGLKDL